MLNAYGLVAGWNNTPVAISVIIDGEPTFTHASSLGTFRAAREFVGLDEITYDDGTDSWEWTFSAIPPSEIAIIEDDVLDGARSGPVTVETRNRYGAWVERNAILTLPAQLSRPDSWESFGPVVFTFTGGRATA